MKPKIFLTGTRAYGPARSDSDFDVVVPEVVAINLFSLLDPLTKTEKNSEVEEYTGYTFDISGYRINVISCKTDEDMERWRLATEEMKKLDPIENRETRINLFKSIRNGRIK